MSRHLMARFRHLASPQFDWKAAPELDDPDAHNAEFVPGSNGNGTFEHHIAPLENGHQLMVRRFSEPGTQWSSGPWDYWIHGVSTQPHLKNYHPSDDSYKILGHGFKGLPSKEHAMQAAEQAYRRLVPLGTHTGPHDSGVDYSDINGIMRQFDDGKL